MRPVRTLPPGYRLDTTFDLSQDVRAMVGLNLAGLALFFAFGWAFVRLSRWMRPGLDATSLRFSSLLQILGLLFIVAFVIVAHELVHGLFFWMFTRDRPKFGFRGAYAFAAAPDWYLPRDPYLVVGLAPLVVITALGLALVAVVPLLAVPAVLLTVTLNAAGAVGDLAVVAWLLTRPAEALINDHGDRFSLYVPA